MQMSRVARTIVKVMFLTAFFIGCAALAQDKPKVEPPKPTPVIAQESRNAIRDNQYEQSKIAERFSQLKDYANQQQTQLVKLQGDLDRLRLEAIKAAKLEPEKWDLDLDRLIFIPKPATTPSTVPAATATKP